MTAGLVPPIVSDVMIKVLFFQYLSRHDGSCGSLRKILDVLPREEYAFSVALSRPEDMGAIVAQDGVRCLHTPWCRLFGRFSGFAFPSWHRSWWSAWMGLAVGVWSCKRLLQRERPDLVYVNSALLPAPVIAARQSGLPVVTHIREYALSGRWNPANALIRHVLRKKGVVNIAISHANRKALGLSSADCQVVYNWIPWAREATPIAGAEGGNREDTTILFMGGESAIKGSHVLYEAIRRIPRTYRFSLIALGYPADGVYLRDRLYQGKMKAAYSGLEKRVRRVGPVSSAKSHVSNCAFVVFPSTAPHFANPVAEAAWLGKPAIMSDDPVGREMIDHERQGLLVPAGDAGALAQAIMRMLDNPAFREKMGEEARRRAWSRYDRRINGMKIRAIIDHALTDHASGSNKAS